LIRGKFSQHKENRSRIEAGDKEGASSGSIEEEGKSFKNFWAEKKRTIQEKNGRKRKISKHIQTVIGKGKE